MSKFTQQEKNNMIKDWKSSNKSIAEWSRQHNIPKSTFNSWVKIFSKKQKILDIKKFIEVPTQSDIFPEVKIVIQGIVISINKNNA